MRSIVRLLDAGRAREALEQALKRSDERPIRGLLPTLCFVNEEREQGLRWLRTLAREDDSPAQLCRLSRLASQVGAFRDARFCLEKAGPDARAERQHLARLRGFTRKALSLADDPEDRVHLVARLGRMEEALKLYASIGGAYGHHQRAEIFLRRGDDERASFEMEKALEDDPGYLWTRWRRAQSRALQGNWRGARAELKRVTPDFQHAVALIQAAWLELRGRHDECEAIRRRYASPLVLQRLRDLREGKMCEWRQYGGREMLQSVSTVVVGPVNLPPVQAFLERELPRVRWKFDHRKMGPLDFETLSQHVMHGNKVAVGHLLKVRPPREQQGILMVTEGEAPWRANRGFGGGRLALVELDPEDVFADSVVAHELGHALLGLQHTDGLKFYQDAFSLQGYPGSMGPLELSYLDFRQKAAMMTFPGRSDLVEEAWELERTGFLERAYRGYREILRRDPLDHWVRGRLARVCLALGRPDEGFKRVHQLRRKDLSFEIGAWAVELSLKHDRPMPPGYPDYDASARLARGRARLRGLDYPGGEFDLWVAYGLAPESKEALLSLGSQALEKGEHQRAERLLRACLKDSPAWGEAWRELALCSAEQGRYAEAVEQLERARELQFESADQVWHEGQVAWLAGRFADARRGFNLARKWAPEQQLPHYSLAWWELCLGSRRTAATWFRRACLQEPASFTGRAANAWLAALAGDLAVARKRCKPLLELVPRNASLNHLMLFCGLKSYRSRLLTLEPNHPVGSRG